MDSANPWDNAFNLTSGTARLNTDEYFNELLKEEHPEKKDKPETFNQFDATAYAYTVNTVMKTIECKNMNIACNPPFKRRYVGNGVEINCKHFFDSWLQNAPLLKVYITNNDNSYHITPTEKKNETNFL